jgi:hypothetical protein
MPASSFPRVPGRFVAAYLRDALLPLLLLAGCVAPTPPAPPAAPPPSGTVELNRKPLKEELIGGGGNGVVYFEGAPYGFAISGLGVYGDAVANLQATGQATQMTRIGQFSGTYRQMPGTGTPPGSDLWLRNEYGVMIHLQPPPQGQLPMLNGDAVRVDLR